MKMLLVRYDFVHYSSSSTYWVSLRLILTIEHNLEFGLMANRDLVVAEQRNRRLQFPCLRDDIAMNGDQVKPSFLIKANGLYVIIRGDQPDVQ